MNPNQTVPEETPEQAYRRGYTDGYVQALNDAYHSQSIPRRLWDFWHNTLSAWAKRGDDGAEEFPPQLK
ncbi:MAG: hypothetical protein HY328_00440 [Chloroflexi bacterium]|nr:hypothetical protein [Chloroflexota bacterium]